MTWYHLLGIGANALVLAMFYADCRANLRRNA
jgi:hypothetical protein